MHVAHSSARFVGMAVGVGMAAAGWISGCAESYAPNVVDTDSDSSGAGRGSAPAGGSGGTGGTGGGSPAGGSQTAGGEPARAGSSAVGGSGASGGAYASAGSPGGSAPIGGKSSNGGTGASAGKSSNGGTGSGGAGRGGSVAVGGMPSGGSVAVGGGGRGGSIAAAGMPSGGQGSVDPDNLLESASFESGTAEGWYKRGTATIAPTTEQFHSGTMALEVTGRSAAWHGVEYDVMSIVTKGQPYAVTLWARFETAASGAALTLTRELTGCTASQFLRIQNVPDAPSGTWIKLSGTLLVPSDCTPTKLAIYVESSDPTASYYIDDTLLEEQAP